MEEPVFIQREYSFKKGVSKTEDDKEKDALFKKVGQLQLENDFLKKSIGKIDKTERMTKVDKTHKLSVSRQCELLNVSRSSFYYSPCKNNFYNEELMKLIDEQYTMTPFYGVPRMVAHLRGLGHRINPKRIRRLYRQMDLYAMGPRPNTSIPHKGNGHSVYPYLLRGYKVNRPNQVWAMDITYVPIDGGHMYLVAIIDLYSRYIVAWSLSNTMTSEWCRECLETAIDRYGAPEIVNTDQGSQFTSPIFTGFTAEYGW
jgi:putative transposase